MINDSAVDYRRLFVSHLPAEIDCSDLLACFSQVGKVVSANIIRDSEGLSKGYGVVVMADDATGLKAIQMLDGSTWGARTITVCPARGIKPTRWQK